jgi:hypothetical protein
MSISSASPVFYPIYSLRNQLEHQEKYGWAPMGEVSLAADVEKNASSASQSESATVSKSQQTINEFLDYAKLSTGEKMLQAWLGKHGMTKEDFEGLSPEKQKKLMDEFKQDMEREANRKIENGVFASITA